MIETSDLFFFVMLILLEEREKHLDYRGFETLHFVQGDNRRDLSEVSDNYCRH